LLQDYGIEVIMLQSQKLTTELNKKNYKTDSGKLKALRTIARANKDSNPALAIEALSMVDYVEKQQADERFGVALVEYARVVGVKPSALTRDQVKTQRQKFDTEEALSE
jgi:DNA polymerase elongation subunit (family B)